MATLFQKIRNNRWWVGFVVIAAGMVAGCGLFQPRTDSLKGEKSVTRNELRREYASSISAYQAKEAAMLAEKQGMVEQYGIAFEDLDIKDAQQRQLIEAVVPLAGGLMGPYGTLLIPAISALFGVTALGDKGRMNRALAKHNVGKGLTPDGLRPLVPPPPGV
jgi:hypothetical protein